MPPAQQHSVWQSLKTRFSTLPAWHKFVCKTAIEKGELEQADIDLAYKYFCIANDLVESEEPAEGEETVPEFTLGDVVPSGDEAACEHIKLDKLAALKNINAISSHSSLSFHPTLTIIYGKNGTGKSGFARVLKASCFSRAGKLDITPDIRIASSSSLPQQASIYLSGVETPITFMPGQHNADLQRIAFFDADAATQHVSGYNPLEFVPAGIDVLEEEIRVFGLVRGTLLEKITTHTGANIYLEQFEGDSVVKTAIATLGASTDIEQLKELSVFGEAEAAELKQAGEDLKNLRDTATLLETEKNGLPQLETFIEQLTALAAHFSSEQLQEYRTAIQHLQGCIEKVRTLQGTLSIDMGALEAEWREFLDKAHALATQINPQYPVANDPCLLCGRPLDGHESLGHVQQFWNFLKDKASVDLAEAGQKIEVNITDLEALSLDICSPATAIRAYILTKNQPLLAAIDAFILALGQQREAVVQFLKGEAEDLADKLGGVPSPVEDLGTLRDSITTQITIIEADGTEALIAAATEKNTLLEHRQKLSTIIDQVEAYVIAQKWAKKADSTLTQLNVGTINTKKTRLIKEFLDGNYEKLFNAELEKLGFGHLEIACDSRSRGTDSAEKFFRIRMHNQVLSPEKILSEGEQKALALADFLAGLSLNPEFCGAIFDDPVTSLDQDIRQCVAGRLVEESAARQIVVFTHDLVFLNQIIKAAKEKEAGFNSHWIERQGDIIGIVNEGECPVTSEKFSNTNFAKECLEEAFTNHTSTERQMRVTIAMGYLRRTLEQAVIESLFKGTVQRWEDRLRMFQLEKIEWLPDGFATKILDAYGEISKYEGGHAVSEESQDSPPSKTTLQKLCATVDDLKGAMKKPAPEKAAA